MTTGLFVIATASNSAGLGDAGDQDQEIATEGRAHGDEALRIPEQKEKEDESREVQDGRDREATHAVTTMMRNSVRFVITPPALVGMDALG